MIVCVGSPYHYIAFKFSVGFSGDYRKFWFTNYNFTYVSIATFGP